MRQEIKVSSQCDSLTSFYTLANVRSVQLEL